MFEGSFFKCHGFQFMHCGHLKIQQGWQKNFKHLAFCCPYLHLFDDHLRLIIYMDLHHLHVHDHVHGFMLMANVPYFSVHVSELGPVLQICAILLKLPVPCCF